MKSSFAILKKTLFAALFAAILAGTLAAASGCLAQARRERQERIQAVLAQMEIVELDHLGYVRYDGEIVKPGVFARRIRARRELVAGKPVLLSVNPELAQNQPAVEPYIRRVLKSVGVGEIYTKVPLSLPPRDEADAANATDAPDTAGASAKK